MSKGKRHNGRQAAQDAPVTVSADDDVRAAILEVRSAIGMLRAVTQDSARLEREAVALHSALTEAIRRLASAQATLAEFELPAAADASFADLLAVLEQPASAPRAWEGID